MKAIVLLFGIGVGAAVTIAAVGVALLTRDARVLLSRDDLHDVDWDDVPQLRVLDGGDGPYL